MLDFDKIKDLKMCGCDERFLEDEDEIKNGRCSFCQDIYNEGYKQGRIDALDENKVTEKGNVK